MSEDDADRFRKQAEEARRQAENSISQLDKEAWLKIAVGMAQAGAIGR
jgi:hypothetical protein